MGVRLHHSRKHYFDAGRAGAGKERHRNSIKIDRAAVQDRQRAGAAKADKEKRSLRTGRADHRRIGSDRVDGRAMSTDRMIKRPVRVVEPVG